MVLAKFAFFSFYKITTNILFFKKKHSGEYRLPKWGICDPGIVKFSKKKIHNKKFSFKNLKITRDQSLFTCCNLFQKSWIWAQENQCIWITGFMEAIKLAMVSSC
jgi:hypothetical protein